MGVRCFVTRKNSLAGTLHPVHHDNTAHFFSLCINNKPLCFRKCANQTMKSLFQSLVGNEDAELLDERRAQAEALLPRRQEEEREDDDEGCDHITWLILLGGLLLLIAVYTMPCSCNLVDNVEQHGAALLRGATAKILRQKDSEVKTDARPRSNNLKPIFITRPLTRTSDDSLLQSSSDEDSSSSSSDFHVYSGLPKSADSDHQDDDFHVYSGLPREPQDDDGFDLPMIEDEVGNDDEEVEQVVVYKMKKRPRRPSEHSSLPHGIFTTKWLKHNFVSFSGSGIDEEAQLLESKEESPSMETDETSHTIPSDDDDEMDGGARATELSTSVEEEDDLHPGYTVSYDEVYVSDSTSGDENDKMNVDSVMLPQRRSLVQRKKF